MPERGLAGGPCSTLSPHGKGERKPVKSSREKTSGPAGARVTLPRQTISLPLPFPT
jgi:hypothetical protein